MDNFVLFKNLMVMALADGAIADEEIKLLTLRSQKWGLSEQQVQEAIDNAAGKEAELLMPKSKADRHVLMRELVHMMSIDGVLADVEKRLCASASAAMGISDAEFDAMLDDLL